MKKGIVVTTYSDKTTSINRYQIIDECLSSLLKNKGDCKVFVVIDGDITEEHKKILRKYRSKFKFVKRVENGGISKSKNTSIKILLDNKIDYGFLCDDDMVFFDTKWSDFYTEAMVKTNIDHFCFFVDNNTSEEVNYLDVELLKDNYPRFGCFMTVTPKLIDRVGYFKVMPYKYGYEHSNFTSRCLNKKLIPFVCDVKGSEKFLNLNEKSLINKSFNPDLNLMEQNKEHLQSINNYEPIIE